MRKYKISFIFLLSLLSFASCSKDEDNFPKVPKETPFYLGYFKGTVNDAPISLVNTDIKTVIHSGIISKRPVGSNGEYITEYYLSIPIGDFSLNMCLDPLEEGTYIIDKGFYSEDAPHVNMIKKDSEPVIYYCPLKAPFKIEVDSIRYHGYSSFPYIEGKMEGILYNENNLQDSIVIKDAIFGIH